MLIKSPSNMKPTTQPTEGGIEELLFEFQKRIYGAIKSDVRSINCSLPQMDILKALSEHETLSLTDLATMLQVSKPSASVMIDTMERHGLLARSIPKNDRRSIAIRLTAKSKKMVETVSKKKKALIQNLLTKLSVKQKKELHVLLETLLNES